METQVLREGNFTTNFTNVTDHADDVSFNVSEAGNYSLGAPNNNLNVVVRWLMLYIVPLIFSFGIFGNSVSFVVFLSEKMRRVSTNVYLAALCASNSVFLLAVVVMWTDLLQLKLMHRPVLCQATVYLTYCSSFMSVWLVVCITVENFVINFFLHKASKHCTVRRALSFVVLLCVTGLLLYDFAIWTTGIISVNGNETQYCASYPVYQTIVELFTLVDISITLIIPTLLILALVIPTCVKNISCNSRGVASSRVMLSRKERALLRVTRLLCVIIVSFVLLTTPTHVNKLRHLFLRQIRGQGPESDDMHIVFICQIFYYLSFSMNFVYFLIWGKNFRERFCHLFVTLYKVLCRCQQKLFFANL